MNSPIDELWERTIDRPLRDISGRPKKEVRAKLVKLGALLASAGPLSAEQEALVQALGGVIETLHLGSLIIDDIQDGSIERRGGPTLHLRYGTPIALNLGSLLFFEALAKVGKLPLTEGLRLKVHEVIHKALVDGHRGQALDLSMPVSQLERSVVEHVCGRSLELKSGALMALAMRLGAMVINPEGDMRRVEEIGSRLGRALQMLDDCGNLNTRSRSPKHLEDLMLRRPSWIWIVLVREYGAGEWDEFLRVIDHLPETRGLEVFLQETRLDKRAYQLAEDYLLQVLADLKAEFGLNPDHLAYQLAEGLTERLRNAYTT